MQSEIATSQRMSSSREQFAAHLAALFKPRELVELRAITSPSADKHRAGRVLCQAWYERDKLIQSFSELNRFNAAGGNIYYGVNPRQDKSGTKQGVTRCRCVWADFDHITYQEAAERWRTFLPNPSIVVCSGSGIHAYWLLSEEHLLEDLPVRESFERMLKSLYLDLGSDSVQDVSRILRLPGFTNQKHGKGLPCELLHCDSAMLYQLKIFTRWRHAEAIPVAQPLIASSIPEGHDVRRIRGLVQYLDREVEDRSQRDYGVICGLLNLGLSPLAIWQLVQSKSKFAIAGEAYFTVTLQNAQRRVGNRRS